MTYNSGMCDPKKDLAIACNMTASAGRRVAIARGFKSTLGSTKQMGHDWDSTGKAEPIRIRLRGPGTVQMLTLQFTSSSEQGLKRERQKARAERLRKSRYFRKEGGS